MGLTGRRGAVVVLGLGAALLTVAVLVLAAGAVRHFDGYAWADRHQVTADGGPAAVRVAADREALIWTWEGDAATSCTVSDRDGELAVRGTAGAHQRPGGGPGDWVAGAAFTPRHDLVTVVCASADRRARAMVEPRPRLPAELAPFGAYGAWGLAAAGLGLVAVLAAPLLARRRSSGQPEPR